MRRRLTAGTPTNDANTLGHELDVVASVRPWKPLAVSAGYAAFVPGAAAKQLSAPDLQHFFYLWLVATF
ncbi:MAG: hypothetical protein JKY37_22265 [Nannocystaceae bacterium]|nr:hypothetical protein [Nannocystaceae bacterium]